MGYVPPCTEEEFNIVRNAMLDEASREWAANLDDWDHGSAVIVEGTVHTDALQLVFDNAVALNLMVKTERGHGLPPVYRTAAYDAYVRKGA